MRAKHTRRAKRLAALLPVLLAISLTMACSALRGPNHSQQDAAAAQRYLYHDIPGYSELDTLDAVFAIDQFVAGASLLSGNFLMAGLIERVGALGQCYRDAGALAARAYTHIAAGKYGLLLVVNQDRVMSNFLRCATRGPVIAQGATEHCLEVGGFRANDDQYLYIYAGTHSDFCAALGAHFAALSG